MERQTECRKAGEGKMRRKQSRVGCVRCVESVGRKAVIVLERHEAWPEDFQSVEEHCA